MSILLKVVIVGDTKTAKTCYLFRYVEGTFSGNTRSTIGIDFKNKDIVSRGKKAVLQIWDTAGQEKFMSMTNSFYKGANGVIVAYDITNRASLETARARFSGLQNEYPDILFMVIGSKVDLADECRNVSWDEGDELARELGSELFFEGKYNNFTILVLFFYLFFYSNLLFFYFYSICKNGLQCE